jgi:hypothetical protein
MYRRGSLAALLQMNVGRESSGENFGYDAAPVTLNAEAL